VVRAQRGSWKKTYQWLRGLGLRRAEKWPWVAAGLDLARREHARLRDMLGAGRHVEQAPRSPLHYVWNETVFTVGRNGTDKTPITYIFND